jgi:two-component system response regulator AtoC
MKRILIVDDDSSIRETFVDYLSNSGYDVRAVGSGEEALGSWAQFEPSLVITDVRMPGMSGLDLLERVRALDEDADVLVITAFEDMETAVAAMKAGAYDYLVKPLDLDQVDLVVGRCFRDRSLRRRMRHLSSKASEEHSMDHLVGRDPKMIAIYKLIGVLAENRTTVLVTGETGTGKERVARAIHFSSPQAHEPFMAVNCTALTENLLESELFGHVRGAFTGAVQSRKGFFELAGKGSVLLDEIGSTGKDFQAKLLRILEEREFYPVGAEKPRTTEARVLAASQRPLEDLVEEGLFREDLLFRLKVVEIRLPPLRERRGDIPLLTRHLLAGISRELHREMVGVSDEALEELTLYDWPGNVRELAHALTRAVVLARGPVIGTDHLALGEGRASEGGGEGGDPLPRTLAEAEAAHVQRILDETGGNKRETARVLEVSRARLDRMIERHGLSG